MTSFLAAALLASTATANMYDITLPLYTTNCSKGCVAWSEAGGVSGNPDQGTINAMFVGGAQAAVAAASSCSMPAAHAGNGECDCGQKDEQTQIFDSYSGPWCFCKDPLPTEPKAQYCAPPLRVPEQINLQIAAPGIVVVGFVTYDNANVTSPPVAMYGLSASNMTSVTGVTHYYAPPGRVMGRWGEMPYHMSYVKLTVIPGKNYVFKVQSGDSAWSDEFNFRAPATEGPTKVATYGDLGHSHYNAMGNVMEEAKAGRIDAVVHMGDHCYNLGFDTDKRGDAYMNAWQPALTTVPWFPIIGNHESSDGDHFLHYEAISWGEAYGQDENAQFPGSPKLHSTATTALGAHLTQGTFYGMGLHGTVPSNTSRYASTNFGLIHMVGLDLNNLDAIQLAWLEADLAAVDRSQVPWIMVMSHFPIFHSKAEENGNMSYAHYVGDELLTNYSLDGQNMDYVPCDVPGCTTIKQAQLKLAEQLQPVFKKYGVDIYNAGHVHSYESTWPMCDFTTGELCNGEQSYVEPKGTMHITEGNGGVPGVTGTFSVASCSKPGSFCRTTGTGGAHAIITAWNHTHLTYEHVQNNGGNVTDTFTIIQSNHGPFSMMR